jgi:esterase/lipase
VAVLFFPEKPEWDVQTMRLAAQSAYGGSDTFETLATARSIAANGLNEESWRQGWSGLGHSLLESIDASAATAGERAARACGYLRTAEFFAPYDSPVRLELYDGSRGAFRASLPTLPVHVDVIEVPDGDVSYDGYVFHRSGGPRGEPGPGVVFLGGADSYAEELFFFGGLALAQRGITVLVADTPGRGSTLRHKGIVSRPDYEVPGARLMDALAALDSVDVERMGVVGLSLGGYYAPRLAAFDERVKACVCWCACFDVLEDVYLFYPPIQPQLRWIVGAGSDEEAQELLRPFNLDAVASRITCPILISHGDADEIMRPPSARKLFDAVSSDVRELRIWSSAEGGAGHCNYDKWADCIPFMFDWLAGRLSAP